jgi:hypothetical protein
MFTARCFSLIVTLLTAFPVLATEPGWQLMEWSDQRLEGRAASMVDALPTGVAIRVEPSLQALRTHHRLRLDLPGERAMEVDLAPAFRHANGDHTLHGHSGPDSPVGGHVHLTIGEQGLFGRIASRAGQFQIHTDSAGTWLVHLDDPRLVVDPDCGVDHQALATPGSTNASRGAEIHQVDVILLYSPDIADRYPGGLLDTRMNHLFAIANQATVDSGVDLIFRKVHQQQVDQPSSPDIFAALLNMRAGLRGEPADVFTDLDQLRAEHGADLVVFTWPHDIETRGACGVAYLPLADEKTGIYDDSLGVHVTNDGISNWSICSDAVMTHEFGHNLGALHQRVNSEQEGFNYAHVVPDILNTVMSSFGSADRNRYLRMNVFSSPDFNCGNAPCGSSVAGEEANNSQILRDFAPVVSDYTVPVYPGIQARPAPSFPDSDGDGVDDWNDPFPFDPYDGNPPPAPEPPGYVIPPLFDGSELDHFELLVASSGNDQVHAYSMQGEWQGMAVQAETLPFPDKRPALSDFTCMSVAEDGLVYMLSSASVRRFDRISRAEVDIFLDSQPPFLSPGGLIDGFPRSMRFNPDQSQLMVLGQGNIQTYGNAANLVTYRGGLPLASDPDTLQNPVRMRDIAFDGSGKHYIIDAAARRIAMFNGPQMADYSGDLVEAGAPELEDPWSLVSGPDGDLYVANGSASNVLRVDITDGSISVFVVAGSGDLDFARDLTFGPDGNLYVISRANNAVLRFDGNSGSFIDAFIPAGSQGLDQPQSLVFTRRIDADIFRDRFDSAATAMAMATSGIDR